MNENRQGIDPRILLHRITDGPRFLLLSGSSILQDGAWQPITRFYLFIEPDLFYAVVTGLVLVM